MIGDLFHLAPALPQGFRYHPDLLTEAEERELAGHMEGPRFRRGQYAWPGRAPAGRHFGSIYGYESWRVTPGPPIPKSSALSDGGPRSWRGSPEALAEVLVNAYPAGAGIGWHRDAPQFGIVIGVSLLAECRLRSRSAEGRRDKPPA